MKKNPVKFYVTKNENIEIIYSKDSYISYGSHTHISNYTLSYILEGCISMKQGKNSIDCFPGDCIITPLNIEHSIRTKNKEYSTLTICIKEDFIYNNDVNYMIKIIEKLVNSLIDKGIISIKNISMIKEGVVNLYKRLSERVIPKREEIYVAKLMIEEKVENFLSINELCDKVFMSEYHFIRTFKAEVGLTPHQFQVQNRIRRAQYLLIQGKSIVEVAQDTGFWDQSHFYRAFRKILGITPLEFLQAQNYL